MQKPFSALTLVAGQQEMASGMQEACISNRQRFYVITYFFIFIFIILFRLQTLNKLESALCGDANPRRLQRQSCCG